MVTFSRFSEILDENCSSKETVDTLLRHCPQRLPRGEGGGKGKMRTGQKGKGIFKFICES